MFYLLNYFVIPLSGLIEIICKHSSFPASCRLLVSNVRSNCCSRDLAKAGKRGGADKKCLKKTFQSFLVISLRSVKVIDHLNTDQSFMNIVDLVDVELLSRGYPLTVTILKKCSSSYHEEVQRIANRQFWKMPSSKYEEVRIMSWWYS